jgi:uncharacterized protein YaaN involved in tellurite resistance
MMEAPREQTRQGSQEELYLALEDRSSQYSQDMTSTWEYSHEELWELYQALRTHHACVQTCYEALETAMGNGQETKALWEEYHEAVRKHRLLTNRLRLALQQRLKNLRSTQEQHKPT